MIVFVSHPFSDNPPLRREQNRALIERLQKMHPDVLFLSPLLLFDALDDDGEFRDEIMDVCEVLIENAANEVWQCVIPDAESDGCSDEEDMTYAAGIPFRLIDKYGYFLPDEGER